MCRSLLSLMLLALLASASAGQGTAPWTVTRELTIDGTGQKLVSPVWLGVRADGSMLVANSNQFAVLTFGPTGSLLDKVGKEGDGAGSFLGLTQGGWLHDTLWINDNRARRLTLISSQGKITRTISTAFDLYFPAGQQISQVSVTGAGTGPHVFGVFPDGSLLIRTPLPASAQMPADWVRPAGATTAFIRFGGNGVAKRMVGWVPRAAPCTSVPPFCQTVFNAVAQDGSVLGFATAALSGPDSGLVRLTLLRSTGDTLLTRSFPYQAIPVPPAAGDSANEALRRAMPPLPAGMSRPPMPQFTPGIYPPVTGLVIGRDSTVWIGGALAGSTRTWTVVDYTGRVLGTVNLPARLSLGIAERRMLWGTERSDSKAAADLVRYRVGG